MDPSRDEIIEIAALKFTEDRVVDKWQSLIRPRGQVPFNITTLTGITNEDVQAAPRFSEVSASLQEFVGKHPIVGQSPQFDVDMLTGSGLRLRNPRYDTFELATILMPDLPAYNLATIAGRPAFFVGLRKPPKPVAPFDRETPAWLPTCVFLDPATLQCRIHDDERYPAECAAYPAHNLALEQPSECERVEDVFGGERLLDADPGETDGLLLGQQAIGGKVFTHPRPEELEGVVERAATGALTATDRAEFVAVAAASSPGTLATSEPHYEAARAQALAADSWAGRAIREWERLEGDAPDPSLGERIEDARGAPGTAGWDALNGSSD